MACDVKRLERGNWQCSLIFVECRESSYDIATILSLNLEERDVAFAVFRIEEMETDSRRHWSMRKSVIVSCSRYIIKTDVNYLQHKRLRNKFCSLKPWMWKLQLSESIFSNQLFIYHKKYVQGIRKSKQQFQENFEKN